MPVKDFSNLLPDTLFAAAEEQGYKPDGRLFPYNSYENRVYEIGVEDHEPLIAKFYRPGRWSLDALKDEHLFMDKLYEEGLPVVPALPLKKAIPGCPSLSKIDNISYCFYEKFKGREHDDLSLDDRKYLGRTLARLHNVGENFEAPHRMILDPKTYGFDNMELILQQSWPPDDLKILLETLLEQSLALIEDYFARPWEYFAVHGDCHMGNVLWNSHGLHLVDFDDMVIAPPIQDLWMLFHGTEGEINQQKEAFFSGYETFREFDYNSFMLTEPLRVLRMIRHTAWVGERYNEEIFKRSFTYFNQRKYWEELVLTLKEEISLLQEPRSTP